MRNPALTRVIAWTLALLLFPRIATARGPAAPATGPEAKGFVLRSADGVNSLRLLGLLQLQLAHDRSDGSPDRSALFVNRARVGLVGSMFSRHLRYTLVAEFSGKSPRLMFLNVDYTFVPDWLSLRVGQFKRPFSRPFMTLASELAMIDRPTPAGPGVFGDNADIGVMLHNGTTGRFEYAVGVFNGAGPNVVPDRIHPLVAARVGYNTAGLMPYSESDLEGGAPRFGVAAAGLVDLGKPGDRQSFVSGLVDVMFKARGLSLSSALYAGSRQAGPRWTDQHFSALGHYTQLGYVIAKRFEPVVRYSFVLPGGEGNHQHDVAGGLNVFFRGHAFKWQTVVSARFQSHDGRATPDVRLQSQLGLAF
ncbi:porin [Nannocystis pusilla]|uniref:Porin n=2 Tax=Nannocystis pusilla TaxID=889268 RepID=A0A9X3F140_9BACT|nr:porin [Nannocystis pusilla]MCY1013350.1 porin [Nannocystis pusilla]